MAEGAHAAAIDGVGLVALDLLGVAVDHAHLDAAACRALPAHAQAPRALTGQLRRLPDTLHDELLLGARAPVEQRHAGGDRRRLQEISSAQPSPFMLMLRRRKSSGTA